MLAPWSGNPEAWSLKLEAIDHDSWTKLSPVIAHNLELSCDGLQLARRCVANFYCEFFHSISSVMLFTPPWLMSAVILLSGITTFSEFENLFIWLQMRLFAFSVMSFSWLTLTMYLVIIFLFYPFFVSVSWRLQLEACGLFLLEIFCSFSHKREINPAHREWNSSLNYCA